MKLAYYATLSVTLLMLASGLDAARFKGTAIRQVHNKTNHDVRIGGKTIKANSTSPMFNGKEDIEIKGKNNSLPFTVRSGRCKRNYNLYDEDWHVWDKRTLIKKKEKGKGKEAILTIKEDGTLRIDQFAAK